MWINNLEKLIYILLKNEFFRINQILLKLLTLSIIKRSKPVLMER